MSDQWFASGKFWTKFPIAFKQVLEEAEKKYNSKGLEYGDSWRTCAESFLEGKLIEEFKEWEHAIKRLPTEVQHKELLDVVNVALMLATRTQKVEEKKAVRNLSQDGESIEMTNAELSIGDEAKTITEKHLKYCDFCKGTVNRECVNLRTELFALARRRREE